MADTFKYVAGQDFYLAGSGVTSSATSITLKSFTFPNSGDNITMTDFGNIGYGTLEPGTGRREFISWTGVTQNANGTATLTGVTRGLQPKAPYTSDSSYQTGHAGNALFRITNAPKFYDELSGKDNDETVTGVWTFTDTAVPRMDTAHSYLAGEEEYFATKRYVDGVAISGVADANTTTKGAVEIATDTELQSGAAAGSGDTTADLVAHAASFNETAAANKVPVADSSGKLGSDWGGSANSLATLNGSSLVVENPANATSTPTASKIPIADGSGKLDDGWLNSTIATTTYVDALNRNYILDASSTTQTVTNNNNETTVFTATVPANLLLAGSSMDIYIYGNFNLVRNTADSHVRVKLNSTTILDASIFELDAGDGFIKIKVAGVTDATQRSMYEIESGSLAYFGTGTSSVDMTTERTLTVTLQGNDSSTDFTVNYRELTINIV